MATLPIVVCGAAGRMGQEILALIEEQADLTLAGAVDPSSGNKAAEGLQKAGLLGTLEERIEAAAVVIDFSVPGAVGEHARICAEAGTPLVVGTTGLTDADEAALEAAAQTIAVVQAPNMSVGVNVLLQAVADLARTLEGYDIEITETHHRAKVDAPSGTALRLAEAAAEGRGWDAKAVSVYGREGQVGPRPAEQIGVMTLRAGDVVGDHTVMFAGAGERIEVTHRAHSRRTFAAGALRAARWVAGREAGRYTMRDVLGL